MRRARYATRKFSLRNNPKHVEFMSYLFVLCYVGIMYIFALTLPPEEIFDVAPDGYEL